MATYARIHSLTKKVVKVIEAESNVIENFSDNELWVETSAELTKKVAGIGDSYDVDNNNFKGSQPYASWTFNTTSWSWVPPITMPTQTGIEVYEWDESAHQADNTTGWIEI